AVHEEPGLRTFDLDPVSGPDARLHIDVRLVLLWSFLPRSGEVEIRIRAVLRGVIPPDLIVGTAVRGPEVDVLVPPIRLEPERDADEAARAAAGAGGGLPRQIHFNHAV